MVGPISITDDDIVQVLGDFFQLCVPGIAVTRGQLNRVPEPLGPNFIVITPQSRTRLATNTHESDDPNGAVLVGSSTRKDLQVDIYGPASTDNSQIITTLFRDDFGCVAMEGTGVQPLYSDDGHQMPLVNGEHQYEDRWMVRMSVQITPTISTPAQFADSVTVHIVEAD